MTLANLDGTGRQVKIIITADHKIAIEAGCFKGGIEEFTARALAESKHFYVAVVAAVADALLAETIRQGITGGW